MPIIALMTDFGTRDHYVAAMKGVIYQINPRAVIVDISHEIGSQDLIHGAFVLRQAMPYFPPETIIAAVVDPTVGSRRRILVGRYNDRVVLAPDNGLLTFLHRDADLQEIRIVENRRFFASTLSRTFHGRDVFAPVAAHISRGAALEQLGPAADRIDILDLPRVEKGADGTTRGEVLVVDHFGNLITNVSEIDLSAARLTNQTLEVQAGEHAVGPILNTYADVAPGEPVALIGSTQMLEIAVNNGSAAEKLGLGRGSPVLLR